MGWESYSVFYNPEAINSVMLNKKSNMPVEADGQSIDAFENSDDIKKNNTQKIKVDMTEGPFLKKMILFAIPLILTGLLQSLYNAADLIVVNLFSESDAPLVGAIGCTTALTNLVLGLFMGLSVGAGVLVAHYVGAKKEKDVNTVLHTSIITAVIFGVIISVVGFFFAESLLVLMETSPDLLPYATLYMQIIFLGTPASLLYNYIASMLRSAGDSKTPLIFLMLSGLLNVLLNIVLVTVFKMDVDGVAIATIASQYASAIMAIVYLMRIKGMLHFSFKNLRIDLKKFKRVLYIGIPSGIQGSLFSLSNTLIQAAMNSIDTNAGANGRIIDGFAATSNLEGFVYIAMHAIYSVSLTFVGQNVGAKKYKNVKKLTAYATLIVFVIGVSMAAVILIFRYQLLGLYISNDSVALEAAITRMSIIIPTYFLCGIMDTLCGSLRALDRSVTSMVISLTCTFVLRIGWIYTVFAAFGTGTSLFLSYPLSWILASSVHLIFIVTTTRKILKKEREEQLLL